MSSTTTKERSKGVNDTTSARKAMIDSQLRTSGVNEEYVLARMMAVPREDFLPKNKASLAYIDRSVALEDGTQLCSPLFYGKLLIEAAPRATDNALLIDGGTGYCAELLRPLVAELTIISAADAAAGNVPEDSFSLVLVDGAVERVPEAVAATLEDGGRLISGLVLRNVTRLASGRQIAGRFALEPVEDIGIPVLHDFDTIKSWTF